MKQPGIFFGLFGGVCLLASEWKHPIDWRGLAMRGGSFLFGLILPFAVTCLIMLTAGVFKSFWFWTFSYAREYASRMSLSDGFQLFKYGAPLAVGPVAMVWIIAGIGATALWWHRELRNHGIFIAGFLLFSFLAVCPGFYFRRHYFILMLPAVSLVTGIAVSAATQKIGRNPRTRAWQVIPLLVFLAAFAYTIAQQRALFFEMDPLTASRALFNVNPFPEALRIAEYLRSHASAEARIAVLGSEPEIYFYAHRHSATGYIYTYGLMEEQKYAFTMQKEMIHEIESTAPEFVVFVGVSTSWLAKPDSEQAKSFFSWAEDYLNSRYELVGIADILDPDHTEYRWGEEATAYTPSSPYTVQVFKRKA